MSLGTLKISRLLSVSSLGPSLAGDHASKGLAPPEDRDDISQTSSKDVLPSPTLRGRSSTFKFAKNPFVSTEQSTDFAAIANAFATQNYTIPPTSPNRDGFFNTITRTLRRNTYRTPSLLGHGETFDHDVIASEQFPVKAPSIMTIETNPDSIISLRYSLLSECPCSEIFATPFLTVLILSNNSITNVPDEICELQHLRKLSLSCNKLAALNPKLSALTSIASLNLASNKLTDEALDQVDWAAMQQLDTVMLAHNQLKRFPTAFIQTSVSKLSLTSNNISDLPDTLKEAANLLWLGLADNNLSSIDALLDLPWMLDGLTLAGNPLRDSADTLTRHLRHIASIFSVSKTSNLGDPLDTVERTRAMTAQLQRDMYKEISRHKVAESQASTPFINSSKQGSRLTMLSGLVRPSNLSLVSGSSMIISPRSQSFNISNSSTEAAIARIVAQSQLPSVSESGRTEEFSSMNIIKEAVTPRLESAVKEANPSNDASASTPEPETVDKTRTPPSITELQLELNLKTSLTDLLTSHQRTNRVSFVGLASEDNNTDDAKMDSAEEGSVKEATQTPDDSKKELQYDLDIARSYLDVAKGNAHVFEENEQVLTRPKSLDSRDLANFKKLQAKYGNGKERNRRASDRFHESSSQLRAPCTFSPDGDKNSSPSSEYLPGQTKTPKKEFKCAQCASTITSGSRVVRASGQVYHDTCFKCSHMTCGTILSDKYYLGGQKMYCEKHKDSAVIRCQVSVAPTAMLTSASTTSPLEAAGPPKETTDATLSRMWSN